MEIRIGARRICVTLGVAVLINITLMTPNLAQAQEQDPEQENAYVGTTKCVACHYAQYKTWKISPHGKAFEILPTKYRQVAECLECHTTESGHSSELTDAARSNLAGISCEACHGAGGKHASLALSFVDKGISEEGEKQLHESISRIVGDQCIKCHVSQAHKTHPAFDREPGLGNVPQGSKRRSGSFFKVEECVPGS